MKTVIIFLGFIFFSQQYCFNQTLNTQIIASAGDEFKNSDLSVDWTLGETITETLSSSTITLTQGFNQTKLIITDIKPSIELSFLIQAYPNPTSDFIYLKTEGIENRKLVYILYDAKGSILLQQSVKSSIEMVDLHSADSGLFFLQVIEDKKMLKTFKITKL